jgi:hypothetical protein
MHQSMGKFKLPWNIDKIHKLTKETKINKINDKDSKTNDKDNKTNGKDSKINDKDNNKENMSKEDILKKGKKFANLSFNRIN